MPFKMHKIIKKFPEKKKKYKYICVPTLPQIFRPVTRNTLIFCPPPFRRKAEGHSFRPSVLPSFRPPNIVGTLCAQLLLQFYADSFETLQMF